MPEGIETNCRFCFGVGDVDPVEAENLRDLLHDVAKLMGYEIWVDGLQISRKEPQLPPIRVGGIDFHLDPPNSPPSQKVGAHLPFHDDPLY